MSLYEEIGGEAVVFAVVDDYWRRVSVHEILSPWFAGLDGTVLTAHMRAYLAVALDGPEGYDGRSMRHAHSGLKITGAAFDLLVTQLNESLIAADASTQSITQVGARLNRLRPVIVELEH